MARKGKLYRMKEGQVFAGVLGGIGKNFGVNISFIRVAFVIVLLILGIIDGFQGMAILLIAYLLAWLFIPVGE